MKDDNQDKLNFQSLFKSFKYCDLFGAPVYFNLKKEETFRSTTGGITFLMLFVFSTWYCIFNFISFATRQNQTLIYSNKIKTDEPLNLTQFNFSFAVGLYDEAKGQDVTKEYDRYFEYSASFVNWTGFDDNSKQKSPISLHRCKYDDFNNYITFKNFNESYKLHNQYCPDITNNFSNVNISGVHSDDVYLYFEVSVALRKEIVNSDVEYDNLKESFKTKPIKFNMYFLDTKFDFENVTQPMSRFPNYLAYYLDLSAFNKLSTKFSPLSFSSDENIFLTDSKTVFNYMFQDFSMDSYVMSDNRTVQDLKYNKDALMLGRTYIQLSQKYVVYQRTYQKFTDYIANMTGILSQLFLVLLVIIGYSNHIGARQQIMNRMMKFKGNKHFDRDLVLKIFEDRIKSILTHESTPNKLFSKNLSASKSLKKIDDSFIDLKSSREKDNLKTAPTLLPPTDFKKMNSFEILMSLCCICQRNWRIKRKIINQGDETVEHYLDVLTYLKKMTELDYMKYLMLNHDQLNIFNFIASPMVSSTPSNNLELQDFFKKEHKQKFEMNNDQIYELLSSYDKFTLITDPTPGDTKLLKIFASQILKIKENNI